MLLALLLFVKLLKILKENNIPIEYYYPNWTKFGRRAGLIRNVEMALVADALVAVWNGYSRGTGHMIDTARAKGLKIYVELYE